MVIYAIMADTLHPSLFTSHHFHLALRATRSAEKVS
jgi:hypothetical protein